MRFLFLLLSLTLAASAAEPAVRLPQKPVDIGDVKLTDGRVLHAAAVVSDTAYTVTVRHDGTVEKIAKELFPEGVLRRWPVDPYRAKKEDRQKAAAEYMAKHNAEAKISHAEFERKNAESEAAYRKKLAAQYERDSPKHASPVITAAEIEQLRRDAQAKELLLCRDSVRFTGFGFYDSKRAINVRAHNPGDHLRALDWRSIRGLTSEGLVVEPLDVVFEGAEHATYDVDHGADRTFTLVFPTSSIAAISWSDRPDLGWINPQGKLVPPEVALAEAGQRTLNARKAKQAGGLQAVDGQLIAK